MKNIFLRIVILLCSVSHLFGQTTIYEDDFESYPLGESLVGHGFEVTSKNEYTGTVSALIDKEDNDQFAALNASDNGQAIMQFRKEIDVVPGTSYVFEVATKGNFKRKLQILSIDNTVLLSSQEFTPDEGEKTQWIKQQLSFASAAGVNKVKLNIYHNWSGTLKIDDIKVTEAATNGPYYLSTSQGDDTNEGTINSPWKTLAKISNTLLFPGDEIFFKKGDRFDGHFVVNGSGTELNPILISSYGTGEKPIITGEVGASGGGDYQEAIYVENNDNIIFSGLEVNNERLVTRAGVDDMDAYGIFILNSGNEVLKNFSFKNMTFQNVYAVKPMNDPDDFNGLEVAAVRIASTKNTVVGLEKNIQNVLMEDCYFTDLQRLGVHIKHAGGSEGVGDDAQNRNKNLVFRRNTFEYIGGTCILPIRSYNCLIEDNIFDHPGDDSDPRMPNRGSSVWTWRCHNTVIQNNQCLHIRGYLDSHGIHIDHENVNTFVQYNYMEDCEGGFVEILGGNVNAVYRFNVSVNDGWRENPNWANSNHTLWLNKNSSKGEHYSNESYIYNNTIVSNTAYTTSIDIKGENTYVFNNIFYALNGANIGGKQVLVDDNGTSFFMKNNLFFGTVATAFKNKDSNPRTGNPLFNKENSGDKFGYQLNLGSPAVDAGLAKTGPPIPGAGTGIFKNISAYPVVDFYGNPVDMTSGTPNIGACNAKNGQVLSVSEGIPGDSRVLIYPNPVKDSLRIKGLSSQTFLSVFSLRGQLVLRDSYKDHLDISSLSNGVYLLKIEGRTSYRFVVAN